MLKSILSLILLLNFAASAAEQIAPLQPEPDEDCHIADAKPLLDAAQYKSRYQLKTLAEKPLTLLESLKLLDGQLLTIEQRGCEDIYFNFTYESPKGANAARALADALTKLKLSKDALINEKQVAEIAEKVKSSLRGTNNLTLCLMKVSSECITDVNVTITPSHVEFFYVDRP